MTLTYQPKNHTFEFQPGVTVRPRPGLAGFRHVAQFGGLAIPFAPYFANFIDSAHAAGYGPRSLGGLPYDWRREYSQLQLRGLDLESVFQVWVEALARCQDPESLDLTGGAAAALQTVRSATDGCAPRPILVVGHSRGALIAARALHRLPASWRAQYVAGLVALGLPLHGSTDPIRFLLTGSTLGVELFGVPFVSRRSIARMSRSYPGILELLVVPNWTEMSGYPVVTSPSHNYTADEFEDMWVASNITELIHATREARQFLQDSRAPGVPVYCIYGTDVRTVLVLHYGTDTLSDVPVREHGSGDGTVPKQSLEHCADWATQQHEPVHLLPIPYSHHKSMLSDPRIIDTILHLAIENRTIHQN